jgi:hypothetical protein
LGIAAISGLPPGRPVVYSVPGALATLSRAARRRQRSIPAAPVDLAAVNLSPRVRIDFLEQSRSALPMGRESIRQDTRLDQRQEFSPAAAPRL